MRKSRFSKKLKSSQRFSITQRKFKLKSILKKKRKGRLSKKKVTKKTRLENQRKIISKRKAKKKIKFAKGVSVPNYQHIEPDDMSQKKRKNYEKLDQYCFSLNKRIL